METGTLQNGIAIEQGGNWAPCCYILCKVVDGDWDERDESTTVLVQTDYDYPGIARAFGWVGEDDQIAEAAEHLDGCEGKVVEDPGYFDEQG